MPLPGVKNPFRSRLARGTRAARTRPLQRVPRRLLGSVWAHAVAGGGRGCGSGRGLRDGRSPPGQGLSGPTLARPLTVAVPSLCPTANEGSGGGPSGVSAHAANGPPRSPRPRTALPRESRGPRRRLPLSHRGGGRHGHAG